jgi:hypothetical protein
MPSTSRFEKADIAPLAVNITSFAVPQYQVFLHFSQKIKGRAKQEPATMKKPFSFFFSVQLRVCA